MPDDTILQVTITDKSYKSADGTTLHAIDNLEFSLAANSFTCMVGPSGCGKTSTLRIILGLDKQFQGQVLDRGAGRVAAVFQEPRLLPWRTVEQNVRLALPRELMSSSLDELFSILGLSGMRDFYPHELSLGLARRAGLARAFAIEPGLLILDEPFVSLDDAISTKLRNLLITTWSARPVTALMVTHNIREAIELSDTILFLSDRPTSVVSKFTIDKPRDARDETYIDTVVEQIKAVEETGVHSNKEGEE